MSELLKNKAEKSAKDRVVIAENQWALPIFEV